MTCSKRLDLPPGYKEHSQAGNFLGMVSIGFVDCTELLCSLLLSVEARIVRIWSDDLASIADLRIMLAWQPEGCGCALR